MYRIFAIFFACTTVALAAILIWLVAPRVGQPTTQQARYDEDVVFPIKTFVGAKALVVAKGTLSGDWIAIKIMPHREVVWVNLADFDRCLLLLLPLWACGQRFFSVVHMPTAMMWGCRWFGRPDLMMVGRERAVRQFRNLAAL